MDKLLTLMSDMKLNAPCNYDKLIKIENEFNFNLPNDYVEFMKNMMVEKVRLVSMVIWRFGMSRRFFLIIMKRMGLFSQMIYCFFFGSRWYNFCV